MAKTYSYAIFFDGTGNNKDEGEESMSNVARLYELYKTDDASLKLYIKGLGTSSAGEIDFGDGNLVGKAFGSGFGLGGQKRVEYALEQVRSFADSVEETDVIELSLFGFSRGAALARHFTNVLDTVPKASVKFLGLFDTVGSFGIPGDESNAGLDLSVREDKVQNVYHLTSFNELRKNFDLVSIKPAPDSILPEKFVEEEYPGVHADIGGGYSNKDEHNNSNNFLALIYLEKMYGAAASQGLKFAKIPEKWTPKEDLRTLFESINSIYQSTPAVKAIHKEMVNLEWTKEVLSRKQSTIRIPRGPKASKSLAASKKQEKELMKRSIQYVDDTTEEIKNKLEVILDEQSTALLNSYKTFEDSYIHKSHYYFNTTVGMLPQAKELKVDDERIEIYQRDIFYI